MVLTFNSSTSAPSLCSALAIADSSTFLMMSAPFFGLKASRLSAFSTGSPRTWSATSRPFWAESRTPYSVARVSMGGHKLGEFALTRIFKSHGMADKKVLEAAAAAGYGGGPGGPGGPGAPAAAGAG